MYIILKYCTIKKVRIPNMRHVPNCKYVCRPSPSGIYDDALLKFARAKIYGLWRYTYFSQFYY